MYMWCQALDMQCPTCGVWCCTCGGCCIQSPSLHSFPQTAGKAGQMQCRSVVPDAVHGVRCCTCGGYCVGPETKPLLHPCSGAQPPWWPPSTPGQGETARSLHPETHQARVRPLHSNTHQTRVRQRDPFTLKHTKPGCDSEIPSLWNTPSQGETVRSIHSETHQARVRQWDPPLWNTPSHTTMSLTSNPLHVTHCHVTHIKATRSEVGGIHLHVTHCHVTHRHVTHQSHKAEVGGICLHVTHCHVTHRHVTHIKSTRQEVGGVCLQEEFVQRQETCHLMCVHCRPVGHQRGQANKEVLKARRPLEGRVIVGRKAVAVDLVVHRHMLSDSSTRHSLRVFLSQRHKTIELCKRLRWVFSHCLTEQSHNATL